MRLTCEHLEPKALKKLKGARLRTFSRDTVDTHAMGRGVTELSSRL